MKLKLSAEMLARCYGLIILDDDFIIDINHSLIPCDLYNKLKEWYKRYHKYVTYTQKQLKEYEEETNLLDLEGEQIVKEIYEASPFENISIYQYYSRGKDRVTLELRN